MKLLSETHNETTPFLDLLFSHGSSLPHGRAARGAFYMTRSPDSIRSFLAHSSQIDLLVPTWYQVDENGLVTGAPDPAVLKRAHDEKLPVMPIISLMNKKEFHTLLTSAAAQAHMNEAMIRESRLNGYTGFQFDFEEVDWTDRDLLTALVKTSAEAMHAAGFAIDHRHRAQCARLPRPGGIFQVDVHRLARRL